MRGFGQACVAVGALLTLLGHTSASRADDERGACGPAYTQALDARRANHLRAARASFVRCAQPVCAKVLEQECLRALRGIDDSLPTVSVRAYDVNGEDVADVRVFVDDELVAEGLTGKALPVDPGVHRFGFERTSQAARTAAPERVILDHVLVVEGEKSRLLKVVFGAPVAPIGPKAPGRAEADRAPSSSPSPPPPSRVPTYVAFGVGAAGAILGSIAGIAAFNGAADARSGCPDQRCPPARHDALDSANTWATVSTVSWVVTGVAVAVGIVTLFVPSRRNTSAFGPRWRAL